MRNSLSNKINILLSLDRDILPGYYNPQDNSPLYKRQLDSELEKYILNSIRSAKRNTKLFFRISYRDEADAEFAEPLMYAIRRHFAESKAIAIIDFENFKRRAFKLLLVSLSVVTISHGVLPFLLNGEKSTIHNGLSNSLDVFSWVILWKPIDRLIFYWNPFLKDISIFDKLEKAEVIVEHVED
jgi:hypothetical protein